MPVAETVLIIVGAITAIATSLSALISWKSWRGKIIAEWDYSWHASEDGYPLSVSVIFRNNTQECYKALSVEVPKLPILALYSGDKKDKHESWGLRRAHLGFNDIIPGSATRFTFKIHPDWSSLSAKRSSRLVISQRSDTPVCIHVTLESKVSRRRLRMSNVKMKISKEAIVRIASKIE